MATTNFPEEHLQALIATATTGTQSALEKVPGITPQIIDAAIHANKESYVQAFKLVYLVAIAFGGAAIICAAFTKTIPKEAKTAQPAVRLENEKGMDGMEMKCIEDGED